MSGAAARVLPGAVSLPLAQRLIYPRQQWYVVAGRPEVGRSLLARRVLGMDLVLFRTEAGAPVALADWCPHRGFRLSASRLEGDTVRCGYHGIRFAADGRCVEVPCQDRIPPAMAVRAFPLVERGHFVWAWMGDPAHPDGQRLPPALEFEDPAMASGFIGHLEAGCNAAVAMENVIDITHASLLHPGVLDTEQWELMSTADEVEQRFCRISRKGAC